MESRVISFPSSARYGDVHYEHGRTWEYVVPGVWKSISGDGDGVNWNDIENKPTQFPPADHKHPISDVDGLQTALDSEEQARIAGDNALQKAVDDEAKARGDKDTLLDLRIDAIEDSIVDDGGFIDAPNDGKLYGRQSESWSEIPDAGVSDWADIENKPTEFPPEAHNQPWSTITNTPTEYPPSSHNHQIGDVDGLQDALDNAGGGVGGVHISDTEPSDPEDGMMWLDSTTATVWVWDEDKWLEFPAGGSGDDYDDTQVQAGIAANTAAIADNAADIADNATEIAKKLDASAYVPYDDTQVKADIATNSSNIADNTAEIATKLDASAYVPYDDTQVQADIAANTAAIDTKLDADKIWTGTETEYNNLTPDADTLYFIV
jgi:hypothetical protein